MVSQWEHILHTTMVQVYVKLFYFVIKANDSSSNDLWEEIIELHDEVDPQKQ